MAYYVELTQIRVKYLNVSAFVPRKYVSTLRVDGTMESMDAIAKALQTSEGDFRVYRPNVLSPDYFVCTGLTWTPNWKRRRDIVGRVDFSQRTLHFGSNRDLCDVVQTGLKKSLNKTFTSSSI